MVMAPPKRAAVIVFFTRWIPFQSFPVRLFCAGHALKLHPKRVCQVCIRKIAGITPIFPARLLESDKEHVCNMHPS